MILDKIQQALIENGYLDNEFNVYLHLSPLTYMNVIEEFNKSKEMFDEDNEESVNLITPTVDDICQYFGVNISIDNDIEDDFEIVRRV